MILQKRAIIDQKLRKKSNPVYTFLSGYKAWHRAGKNHAGVNEGPLFVDL